MEILPSDDTVLFLEVMRRRSSVPAACRIITVILLGYTQKNAATVPVYIGPVRSKIEFLDCANPKEGKMNNAGHIFDIVFLIGRIIAGGFFLMNGFNHFAKLGMMSGYAKSKGTPLPGLAVGGSGVLLVLGGASLLLGYHPTVGAILLVIFLLGVSFPLHNFWAVQEPQAKMTEMVNFMKNMALLGFVLMTVAIPRPWPMSLGN